MPEYTYACKEGHEREITENMISQHDHYCLECMALMWRKPQMPAVNWSGLRPSQGELAPLIQDMVDNEDENRANFIKRKENTK